MTWNTGAYDLINSPLPPTVLFCFGLLMIGLILLLLIWVGLKYFICKELFSKRVVILSHSKED